MVATIMQCPKLDLLRTFRTVELSESLADELIPHISECDNCQQTLAALGAVDDTFLAKLRSPETTDPFAAEP